MSYKETDWKSLKKYRYEVPPEAPNEDVITMAQIMYMFGLSSYMVTKLKEMGFLIPVETYQECICPCYLKDGFWQNVESFQEQVEMLWEEERIESHNWRVRNK